MHPLASFDYLIRLGRDLCLMVLTRDRLEMRPLQGKRAVARRLGSGLRVLGAWLRRLLVLMALALEPHLTVREQPLARPHGRKTEARMRFVVWTSDTVLPEDFGCRSGAAAGSGFPGGGCSALAGPVGLARLYRQLDLMAAILADPLPRARRLAIHLARSRPGLLLAPAGPPRIAGRWGKEVSTSYDGMAVTIMEQARVRPPPLPPPRRGWRSITLV
jgi:hypothetical protein